MGEGSVRRHDTLPRVQSVVWAQRHSVLPDSTDRRRGDADEIRKSGHGNMRCHFCRPAWFVSLFGYGCDNRRGAVRRRHASANPNPVHAQMRGRKLRGHDATSNPYRTSGPFLHFQRRSGLHYAGTTEHLCDCLWRAGMAETRRKLKLWTDENVVDVLRHVFECRTIVVVDEERVGSCSCVAADKCVAEPRKKVAKRG
jgi:hypothetical protein